MNTWNTINVGCDTTLSDAIFALDILTHPNSIPLLDYLLQHGEATLLDLMIHTGMDMALLERQMKQLCMTKVVSWHHDLYGSYFCINQKRLQKVQRIAKQLARL